MAYYVTKENNLMYYDAEFLSNLKMCIYQELNIFLTDVLGINDNDFYLAPKDDNINMDKVKKYLKDVFNIQSEYSDKEDLLVFTKNLVINRPLHFNLTQDEIDKCAALLKLKGF